MFIKFILVQIYFQLKFNSNRNLLKYFVDVVNLSSLPQIENIVIDSCFTLSHLKRHRC